MHFEIIHSESLESEESLEDAEFAVSFNDREKDMTSLLFSFCGVVLCGRGCGFPDDYFIFLKKDGSPEMNFEVFLLLIWEIIVIFVHIFGKGQQDR